MCWVAELHYRGVDVPKDVSEVYSGISKENLENMQANKCRKMVQYINFFVDVSFLISRIPLSRSLALLP